MDNHIEPAIKLVFPEPFSLPVGGSFILRIDDFRRRIKALNIDLKSNGHEPLTEGSIRRYFQQLGIFGTDYILNHHQLMFSRPSAQQIADAKQGEERRMASRRHTLNNIWRAEGNLRIAETSRYYSRAVDSIAWNIREAERELGWISPLSTDIDIIDRLRKSISAFNANRHNYYDKIKQLSGNEEATKILCKMWQEHGEQDKSKSLPIWAFIAASVFFLASILYAISRHYS